MNPFRHWAALVVVVALLNHIGLYDWSTDAVYQIAMIYFAAFALWELGKISEKLEHCAIKAGDND